MGNERGRDDDDRCAERFTFDFVRKGRVCRASGCGVAAPAIRADRAAEVQGRDGEKARSAGTRRRHAVYHAVAPGLFGETRRRKVSAVSDAGRRRVRAGAAGEPAGQVRGAAWTCLLGRSGAAVRGAGRVSGAETRENLKAYNAERGLAR